MLRRDERGQEFGRDSRLRPAYAASLSAARYGGKALMTELAVNKAKGLL